MHYISDESNEESESNEFKCSNREDQEEGFVVGTL